MTQTEILDRINHLKATKPEGWYEEAKRLAWVLLNEEYGDPVPINPLHPYPESDLHNELPVSYHFVPLWEEPERELPEGCHHTFKVSKQEDQ